MPSFVRFSRVLCLFAFLFSVCALAAEKVYLAPIRLEGIHEDYSLASAKLMKAYMEEDGRFTLVEGTAQDSATIGDQAKIEQVAKSKECTKYIVAEFTRLGEDVTMSFKLYEVGNAAPVWSDAPKAHGPDEFDPIIQRVSKKMGVKEVSENKAPQSSSSSATVVQQPSSSSKSNDIVYFGMSISGFMALNPIAEMDAGFSLFLLYDSRSAFFFTVDFNSYGLSSESNLSYFDFGITVDYPFGTKLFTPFAGAGLSYSMNSYEYDGNEQYSFITGFESTEDHGITGFLDGGIMFNRTGKLMFILRTRYICNFYKTTSYDIEKDKMGGLEIIRKKNLIHGPSISLGMGYGF